MLSLRRWLVIVLALVFTLTGVFSLSSSICMHLSAVSQAAAAVASCHETDAVSSVKKAPSTHNCSQCWVCQALPLLGALFSLLLLLKRRDVFFFSSFDFVSHIQDSLDPPPKRLVLA